MRSRTVASATIAVATCVTVGIFGRMTPAHTAPGIPLGLCGSERWSVKTLTDAAASKVAFARSKTTSVEALRHLKAPLSLKTSTPRAAGTERTVYRVTALLMSMR